MNNETISYGFVYLTTNLINGKKYLGQRKYHRNNPKSDERYLGSGTLLMRAVKKYGRNNFSRVILEECSSKEELDNAEIKWIEHYDAIFSKEFYNIGVGGSGGDNWTSQSQYKKRKFRRRISESNKTRKLKPHRLEGENNPASGRHWYKDVKNRKQYYLHEDDPLILELGLVKGMFRSKKHNEKIGNALRGKRKSYVVHVKGKIAVSKGNSVKFISLDELDKYISDGYIKGNVATKKQHCVYMNDGVNNRLVNKKQINHYLSLGYRIGKIKQVNTP